MKPYKVFQVEGGFRVYRVDAEAHPLHVADGRKKPYPQKTNAYRKCRELNKAEQEIDAMIKKDGAIIL
jgi:hypothetical protein